MMRPRATPSPKSSVYPQNDVATYRDLLLFEERLKTTAASLQQRKSRYQLFLFQLLLIIGFLLAEVLLPPDISLLAIPYKLALQRVLPDIYKEDTEVHVHPYFSTGLLFVSITTLVLFFASGTYSDKIAYANKYVPHANRALRSFNMYFNVRKPPLRSKLYFNPFSFFFPRPTEDHPSPPPNSRAFSSVGPTQPPTTVPIPPIPPTTNPRGELRFSSRVNYSFQEGYERYRANFERRRAQQQQLERGQGWLVRITSWRPWRRDAPASSSSAGVSGPGVARMKSESGVRSGTPPLAGPQEKEGRGSPATPRRQRSNSPLQGYTVDRERTDSSPFDGGSPDRRRPAGGRTRT
ncbi:Sporulation-specific protein spo7 [Mycena venus]|uniref:Transmembrane protein 188 n=1 Tax=Mycena venus TaxID=2733690 RepID=A0A8H6Z259_9AGAR|nr:Sporulation-specific protein spo7 [Mycena venus]